MLRCHYAAVLCVILAARMPCVHHPPIASHTGTLNKEEMRAILQSRSGGKPMTDAAFAKLWAQIDTDNSGTIQPQEFIAYCSGGAAVAADQSGSAAAIKKEALRAIPPEDEEELSLTDSEAEGGGEEAE